MRWVDCPAHWSVFAADGMPTGAANTPMRMDVFVHDDDSATVSFQTESGELVVLAGTKRAGDIYVLTTACPHFEGKLVVMIDTLHRYASGVLQKDGCAHTPAWHAKVDIFLEVSQDEA